MMLWLFVTGLAAGVCAGVFGIGGGIILVPALVFLFHYPQATANGTSLVAMLLPVSILGALEYYRAGKIELYHVRIGLWIAVGIFFGSYIGAKLAASLPDKRLSKIFAGLMFIFATKLFLR